MPSTNTLLSLAFFGAIIFGVYWFINKPSAATKSARKSGKGVCPCSATQWQLNEDLLDQDTGEVMLVKGSVVNGKPVDGILSTDEFDIPVEGCTPIG